MDELPSSEDLTPLAVRFDIVVDAIFGYSFTGEMREPFINVINTIKNS